MRILSNVQDLGPTNGITVQAFQLSKDLAKRGHEIELLYVNDGPFQQSYLAAGVSLSRVALMDMHLKGALPDGRLVIPAVRAGSAYRPDVIYAHRMQTVPWAVMTAATARVRVVAHLHGPTGCSHRAVNALLGRSVHKILAGSEALRDELVDGGFPSRKVDVVHYGIDLADYPFGDMSQRDQARLRLGIDPDCFLVMYFGRLDPTKGIETLFEAIDRIRKRSPDTMLLVLGSPATVEYLRVIRPQMRAVSAKWLPNQPDVITPLHAADVVVVPSVWNEPFGRVAIEAMATGRPVLASRVGGLPEILTGPLDRFLFPANDVDALVASVDSVAAWRRDDPDLGRRCREHVANHFTLETMTDLVEQHLEAASRHTTRIPRRVNRHNL